LENICYSRSGDFILFGSSRFDIWDFPSQICDLKSKDLRFGVGDLIWDLPTTANHYSKTPLDLTHICQQKMPLKWCISACVFITVNGAIILSLFAVVLLLLQLFNELLCL